MKILITSDVHGDISKLIKLQELESFDLHLDAGDSNIHVDTLNMMQIVSVKGNTDFFSQLPPIRVIENSLGKIIIVHGHTQNVKSGFELIEYVAQNLRADYLIYGHTHNPRIEKINNITYINPGSLKYGDTYAVIDGSKIEIRKIQDGK